MTPKEKAIFLVETHRMLSTPIEIIYYHAMNTVIEVVTQLASLPIFTPEIEVTRKYWSDVRDCLVVMIKDNQTAVLKKGGANSPPTT